MKTMTTYLVVEIRAAYAVVLDNSGRFIKTADLGYKVGDTIDKIIPLQYPENKKSRKNKIIRLAASLAACICLCVFGVYEYQYMFVEYGSVHMQINPQVEISLSRSGRVLDIEGENADGEALLKGYSFKGKDKGTVADELAALAIEQQYLTQGGTIAIFADAPSSGWSDKMENEILNELNRYLQEQGKEILEEPQTVTIPIAPPVTSPSAPGPQGDSGYDSSGNEGDSIYSEESENSSYGSDEDGDSSFDD